MDAHGGQDAKAARYDDGREGDDQAVAQSLSQAAVPEQLAVPAERKSAQGEAADRLIVEGKELNDHERRKQEKQDERRPDPEGEFRGVAEHQTAPRGLP